MIFRDRNVIVFGIITGDPSIYTMDHPDLTVSNVMGNSFGTQRLNFSSLIKKWSWHQEEKKNKIKIQGQT